MMMEKEVHVCRCIYRSADLHGVQRRLLQLSKDLDLINSTTKGPKNREKDDKSPTYLLDSDLGMHIC